MVRAEKKNAYRKRHKRKTGVRTRVQTTHVSNCWALTVAPSVACNLRLYGDVILVSRRLRKNSKRNLQPRFGGWPGGRKGQRPGTWGLSNKAVDSRLLYSTASYPRRPELYLVWKVQAFHAHSLMTVWKVWAFTSTGLPPPGKKLNSYSIFWSMKSTFLCIVMIFYHQQGKVWEP